MSTLRNIALTVAEPKPGVYFWRLLESSEEPPNWQPFRESKAGHREWIDALNEGIDEVMTLTLDGRVGPR